MASARAARDLTVPTGTPSVLAVSASLTPGDEPAGQHLPVALGQGGEHGQQAADLRTIDDGSPTGSASAGAAVQRGEPLLAAAPPGVERRAFLAWLATMRSSHERTGASPR